MKKVAKNGLGILLLFVALNAFAGGYYGLAGAKGIPLEWLARTPFSNYTIPSVILIVAVGGSSLLGGISVLARTRHCMLFAIVAGIVMLIWIAVQLSMIGYVSWMQPAIALCGLVTTLIGTSFRLRASQN
jgi:hypothetical protein